MSERITKRIYFVRHGESTANVERLVQGSEDPLTETGERQALTIAARAQNISFDTLISSDYARAKSTAFRIGEACNKEIEFSELFREYKRPTSMVGKPHSDPAYQALLREEHAHYFEEGWQFEDAENFYSARERARQALAFLRDHTSDSILVVTHGFFLRLMIGLIITKGELKPEHAVLFHQTIRIPSNTAITVCTYEDDFWKLLTWNDHAHFAE